MALQRSNFVAATKKFLFLGAILSLGVLLVEASSTAQLLDNGLSCKFVYPIEQGFMNQHILGMERDNKLRDRIVDTYIKRLDPTKIFFLQSDIDSIRKMTSTMLDQTKSRDCGFLDSIEKLYVERVKERSEFAKNFLGASYKFDSTVEFVFDPDKQPFAKSKDEINEFLKKYIHYQISNYLATDMKVDEAKSNVARNYERLLKRTAEKRKTDIFSDYLDSFARALDPHSSFFSKEVQEDFDIQMSLQLEGIGATLRSEDGFTIVEALVPGGAAARSTLVKAGDKIVAVGQGEDGKLDNVIEMELRDVVSRIRGKKGTKVRLQILRKEGEKNERVEAVLTRDKIKLEEDAAKISYIEKEINGVKVTLGVLDFPSFYAGGGRSSAADMKKLITEARAKKVEGLVLDLSNNGGGSLDDAVKIAGLFFRTGNVVKQSSRDELKGETPLADTDPTVDFSGPLVVLTSRISASASEIVSGTLKDYKRAVIVGGDHTFGKGSIQTVVRIPQDLGAIKVTIGMFFTPGGNSTQHRGVEGDISLPSLWNGEEFGEKSLDYSLPPKKITQFISPEAYVKDGPGAWKTIEPAWIKTLKERSGSRVAQDSDFKKIIEDTKKALERGKLIKLSEYQKDKAEKDKEKKAKKDADPSAKEKGYLARADIKESVNILVDLLSLENKYKLPVILAGDSKAKKTVTTTDKM